MHTISLHHVCTIFLKINFISDLRRENPEAVDRRHEFITANLKPERMSVLSMTNIALQMTMPAAPLID